MMIKVICKLLYFSDPKNKIHSVQICINSRWQTKNKTGQLLSKFLKRAQEKQSESSSQLCTITVYGEGAMPLSKPQEYSFRAAAREKWVTFQGENFFFASEKHIKLKSTIEIQH